MGLNLKKITGDFFGGLARGVDRNIVKPITHPDINAAVGAVARRVVPGLADIQRTQQQAQAGLKSPMVQTAMRNPNTPSIAKNYINYAQNVATKPIDYGNVVNQVGGTVTRPIAKALPQTQPVGRFLNENIVQPQLQTLTRTTSAGQGYKPYASGSKGVGQLTQDVTNIATDILPGAGEGLKLGSRLALNALPGAATSIGNDLAQGNRNAVDIGKNALLSGAATATLGEGGRLVGKGLGKLSKPTAQVAETGVGKISVKPKTVTPTIIDKNTSGAMGRLNALDEATPRPQGTVRVYSAGKKGTTGDWVFDNPDALANFKNNNAVKGEVFRFHDVNPNDLIKTQREGIMQIRPEVQQAVTTGRKSVSVGLKQEPYAYQGSVNERAPRVKATAKDALMTDQGPISREEIQRLSKIEADRMKNIDQPAPRVEITGKPTKDPRVQEVLQSISRGRSNVDANLTTAEIQAAAKQAGVKLDQGFIDRYQAGKVLPNEQGVASKIKQVTDRIFEQQKALDPTIEYRKNYVPQVYAQADNIVEDAAKKLQTSTGAANPRAFNSYQEAAQFGLTPKYSSLDQIIGTNAGSASRATVNRQAVESGLKSGIFDVYPDKGWSPVVGFTDNQGNQIYAQKSVADTLNGITQKGTGGLEKALSKTAKASGKLQDVMLQGGLPGTNFNFFTFGQGVKDTTRNIGKATLHPVQAVKQETNLIGDFFRGKNGTIKRFAKPENQAFVKEMADRGLYINPQTSISNIGKSSLEKGWDWLGNNPTFGRYMPNRMLSTAQEVYQQSVGKIGHQAALDLATETTKRFTGQVDQIMKGRSNLSADAIASVAFAPKYRESIITALNNVAKSVYPKNWADKTYAPSRQLLAGMAATLAGYEALNQQITGHSMFENRKGQELSLEIPYGEKDAKGNQKVVNIPFMPGFMTIPRAIVGAGQDVLKGDVKGVLAEASKGLSAPIQTIGRVAANQDYFGRPIYIDQATADKEGITPDSAGSAIGKIAAYAGGQSSPAWVRAGLDAAQGKPIEQNVATALEAPVRFGKVNPEQTAYFDSKDAFYKGLNKNEKTLFDKLNPTKKDSRGNLIQGDRLPLASAANYGDLVANEAFAKKYQEYKKSQPNHDPLWDLSPTQLRSYMQAQVISKNDPGGDSTTVRKLYDRLPDDFFDKRSAYFEELKSKGVLAKDDPNYKPRPKMPKELQGFADSYQTLPHGTGARSKALRSELGQQYIAYLNANKLYNNQERADLGLPPLEDTSSSYASKGGGGRSARAANPDKYRISTKAKTSVAKAKFGKPTALAKVKVSNVKLAKAKTATTRSKV